MNDKLKQAVFRVAATAMVTTMVTAGFLVNTAEEEGYVETASIPVKGDVPTNGYGSTKGVKLGDKTDPVRALVRLNQELEDYYAKTLRKCLGETPVSQGEWDALLDLAYNIGPNAVCSRARPGKPPQLMDLFHQGRYDEGCTRIKEFNCGPSGYPGITVDKCGEGKKILRGLVNRRERTYQTCMKGKSAYD